MNATLLVASGKTTKRQVALNLPCVLGRSREADVTVAHPLISRKHCELSEAGGAIFLRDLASLNGTMIGGRRVASAALLPGSEFTIGPLTFRVIYEYDGDLESLPPTSYAEEAEVPELDFAETEVDDRDEAPLEVDEAAVPSLSDSNIVDVADLAEWADADPEDIIPAIPATAPAPRAPSPRKGQSTSKERPVEAVLMPMEPQENDSSLQSGGVKRESPWSVEEQVTKPPAKKTPAAKAPPAQSPAVEKEMPNVGAEIDPEFGNFLDDLQ